MSHVKEKSYTETDLGLIKKFKWLNKDINRNMEHINIFQSELLNIKILMYEVKNTLNEINQIKNC